MIASLPMYDWPELGDAHDAFWREIAGAFRARGIDAPSSLERRDNDEGHWLAPDLLVSQTCGYPLATTLAGKVKYLATPVYDITGCQGPYYSSAIITHRQSGLDLDTLAGRRFAYNGSNSLSGYRAVKALLGDPASFFRTRHESGSHRLSARMVAQGKADVAALDAVCWHFLECFEPETAHQLSVIGWTDLRPALPFITSLETDEETVREMRQALAGIAQNEPLKLGGFELLPLDEYAKLALL